MRNAYEINPFLRRDNINKWRFKNDDSSFIPKFGIVRTNVADLRLGCVRAQSGVNTDPSTPLWYAQQDIYPGDKGQFFRTGLVPIPTGANPVDTPVYLSDTSPGGVVFSPPANAIILGHVLAQDLVFLDLAARGAPNEKNHLDTREYWVNSAEAADGRQFTTIDEALAQIAGDTPIGASATINVAPDQTYVVTPTALTGRSYTFRGGRVDFGAGTSFTGGGSTHKVRFEDCTLSGTVTVDHEVDVEMNGCHSPTAFTVNSAETSAGVRSTTATSCTGFISFTQDASVPAGVVRFVRLYSCALATNATLPRVADVHGSLVVLYGCSLRSESSPSPPFRLDSGAPSASAVILSGCEVECSSLDLFQDDGGPANPPVVNIIGGTLSAGALGEPVTCKGLPFIDLGDRSGSVVTGVDAEFIGPCYEAGGRTLTTYSPSLQNWLGHINAVEFSFPEAVDDSPQSGTLLPSGDSELLVPSGETWFVTVHRVLRNGATLAADKRHFVVYNNAGATITAAAAADTDPVGAPPGGVSIIPGAGGGTFQVQSTAAAGWSARVTLTIDAVSGKSGW